MLTMNLHDQMFQMAYLLMQKKNCEKITLTYFKNFEFMAQQCLFQDLKKVGDLPARFEKMWGIFKKCGGIIR